MSYFRYRRRFNMDSPMSMRFGRHARPALRPSWRQPCRGYPTYVRFYCYGSRNDRRDIDFGSLPTTTAPAPDDTTLTVTNVDLKIAANTKAHRTNEYDITTGSNANLVIRRGQPFDVQISFSKAYDTETDDLRLIFELGDDPRKSKGTQVEIILSDEDKPNEWGAKIVSSRGKDLTITVFTPPDLMIGKWEFRLDVIKKDAEFFNRYRYTHDDDIYILFNPWCKDDQVYLESEEYRNEYVLNDRGRIFSGTQNNITSKPWFFGQFDSPVLDTALYLLDVGSVKMQVRGNPIVIVRKISALVNSSDEGGVLVGNWSGDYKGGKSPLSWPGSYSILEQYWKTRRPVAFGQCWVFSGVTTTVLRALGIPGRSVTNFSSAHDTDGSITIDYHYNELGEPEGNDDDSVWNFHVWNECWLSRPDLPQGYGGWQVIDATPQEASDNVYCCGPVSCQAIKHGEVNLPFDGPFVFAEVNADKVFWVRTPFGYKVVNIAKQAVGKFISTKAPRSNNREDITHQYKAEEGSAAERAAVMKANQVGSNRNDIYEKGTQDVTFEIKQDTKNSWVGHDFKVSLAFKNTSSTNRTVSGRFVIKAMYYTGVVGDTIKTIPFTNKFLRAGVSGMKEVITTESEYADKLLDGCMLDVSIWATVQETNQHFTAKENFRLRKPHLTIKAPKEAVVNRELAVDISFTNPLNKTLTNCAIDIDGLAASVSIPQRNVPPKSTFHCTIHVTPKKAGHKELVIIFNSRQLEDINTAHEVFIKN